MYVLAIETTGAFASVALAESSGEDCRIMADVKGNDRFSHLQNLTPQIEEVISKSGLSINDVDAIAVSNGPGSFTGIRIGVSTARALAQAAGRKCVAVSSLEGLAMRAGESMSEDGTLVCPILDARRSQIYGGAYLIRDGFPHEEVKAGPYTIDEFIELIRDYDRVYFLGDGVDAYAERIAELRTEGVTYAPETERYQSAVQIAELGCRRLDRGEGCSYEELKPEYMRLAEAERKLKEAQARTR